MSEEYKKQLECYYGKVADTRYYKYYQLSQMISEQIKKDTEEYLKRMQLSGDMNNACKSGWKYPGKIGYVSCTVTIPKEDQDQEEEIHTLKPGRMIMINGIPLTRD